MGLLGLGLILSVPPVAEKEAASVSRQRTTASEAGKPANPARHTPIGTVTD
jgi:hypothetical protein